jgi:hypothetical protein
MKNISWIEVESSNLDAVAYQEGQGLLVRFKAGTVYRYPTASVLMFHELIESNSKGRFFHEHIRPLDFEKLELNLVDEAAPEGGREVEAGSLPAGALAYVGAAFTNTLDFTGAPS